MKIKIAVLLTTYNSSNFIEDQIKSILNQEHVDPYIYVSDDKSSDNTLEIIEDICPQESYELIQNESKFGKPGLNFF